MSPLRCVYSRSADTLAASLLLVCGLVHLNAVHAIDLGDNAQMHGFFSQAAAISEHYDIGGNSSDGPALDLRELGANVSWRPDPDWLLAAQALMRWAGVADDGALRLDFGFVDHTLLSEDYRLGIQLGKIKIPYGFHNTTRDVAHTRPGVIMPQSLYLDRIRHFVLAAPGAALYGERQYEWGSLSWHASMLRPEVEDVELEYVILQGERPGRFKGDSSWFAHTMWESDGARWRAGLSLAKMAMHYDPGPDRLLAGKTRLHTAAISLQHNLEHWSFTAEYAQTRSRNRHYGSPLLEQDNTVEAFYLQADWRFRPRWQAYARYDAIYIDKNDKKGLRFQHATGLPAHLVYAEDKTLGVRFDVDAAWAIFLEMHRVEGAAWLPRIQADGPKKWNLLLFQVAYRF